jgi:O-antigen/teichoic acid export membrane protein
VIYSFGALFVKGVSFLLIPLYTKALTPEEYGILDLLSTFANVLDITLGLGLLSAALLEYYHKTTQERRVFFNVILQVYLRISGLLYVVALILVLIFRDHLFPNTKMLLIVLTAATSYLSFFQGFLIFIFKQSQKVLHATLLQIAVGTIAIALNIWFVLGIDWKMDGIVWSSFISVICLLLYALYALGQLMDLNFRVSFQDMRSVVLLGLPFVPNALALWLLNYSNRWIILHYCSADELGYFSAAVKFSSLFDPLIIQPFIGAYAPRVLERMRRGEMKQNFTQIAYSGAIGFAIAGFLVQQIATFMLAQPYHPALQLIPYLVFSNFFALMAQVLASVLVFKKMVRPMLFAISAGALSTVILNLLLVPSLGGWGAAIAANGGALVWCALIYFYQNKTMKHHR